MTLSVIFLTGVCVFSIAGYFFFDYIIPLMVLGGCLGGLLAYYIYVRFNRQPMRVRCESCLGSVECKTPWVCGHCGHENWNINRYPFINECENCHIPPKSYICHHCENDDKGEQHIYFSEDKDKSNPARRIRQQGLEVKRRAQTDLEAERAFEEKKRGLKEENDQKKQTVESAQLDLVTEQIKAQIKLAKEAGTMPVETAANIYYEAWKKFKGSSDALDEAFNTIDRELTEKYKGNDTLLAKEKLKLKAWRAQELIKLTKNPPQK
jgi:hypothetical protein